MIGSTVNTQNKVYNDKRRSFLDKSDLKEGEQFCSKCRGRGTDDIDNNSFYGPTCSKCQGKGIVDWIENIVGKTPQPSGNVYSSCASYVNTGFGSLPGNIATSRVLKNNYSKLAVPIPYGPITIRKKSIISRIYDWIKIRYIVTNI